ncbi:ketopantoate reductase PanE/ApbA-domain-containing protein [Bombardia bombarda]|uniref:Ketopantoate reductase PanE/ApbA-domain-containing protein n=1 Tax=Bombardia bombarda TaxID=252184 RepID=A0AA40CAL2_9PEZI|nr:ketopantoate reductase PanE/ApbA-domain-containing protein [Bombardia bombarda]
MAAHAPCRFPHSAHFIRSSFIFLLQTSARPSVTLSSSRIRTTIRNMGSMTETKKANVLIVGSGGVGTMAAYALEKGGKASVTAVLRSNFSAVEKAGFSIDSIDHGMIHGWRPTKTLNAIPNMTKENTLPPYDYILVTTKNIPDIPPSIATLIAPAVTPAHTAIALLQNGLNIERPLSAAFPTNPIISGISFIGATEGPPGTIKHDDHDVLVVGAFHHNPGVEQQERADAAAELLVDMYDACEGVECMYRPDVLFWRWRKLLYNASYNSVATILGMDTSRMRASEHVVDGLVRPVMGEICEVARAAAGVRLDGGMVEGMILADTYEAFFKPSMLQGFEKGNFIEFENIVGEPLREAERVGVATPTLRVIYELLKGLQWKIKEAKGLVKVPLTRDEKPGFKYSGVGRPRDVTG